MTAEKIKIQAELAFAIQYDFSEIIENIKKHTQCIKKTGENTEEINAILQQIKIAEVILKQLKSFVKQNQ